MIHSGSTKFHKSEGKVMKNNTKEVAINAVNRILDGISEEELQTFVRVLNRACNNIEQLQV